MKIKIFKRLKRSGIFALTICLGGMMSGCSDFLEIKSLNDITFDNFWNEETDVNQVIAGCYSGMQAQSFIDRQMVWGELRSENFIKGDRINEDVNLGNILSEDINSANPYTSWVDFYSVINRCNNVMMYAPVVSQRDPNFTDEKLNTAIAEATAIRSLCYFYLIRAFKDVPYSTVAFTDDNQLMAVSPLKFDAILDSLITDLEKVQNNAPRVYPSSKSNYQTGRITQAAIHSMLSEMYLWKKDYAKCIEYADKVIDAKVKDYEETIAKRGGSTSGNMDKLINGFPLINDEYGTSKTFGNASGKIFVDGGSAETILEMYFEKDNNRLPNWAVGVRYGTATKAPFIVPSEYISQSLKDVVASTAESDASLLFKSKNDMRYYENVASSGSSSTVAKYAYQSVTVSPTEEYGIFRGEQYPEKYCHAPWIIYRLPDVMLLKAEATAQLIDDDTTTLTGTNDSLLRVCFNIVNAINLRSHYNKQLGDTLQFKNYRSKELMTNLIFDERNRELMFEGKRWFDLVRRSMRDGNTKYLVQKIRQKGASNADAVATQLENMNRIFWPYNEEEMKVNTKLVQNPAFGDGGNKSYDVTK